MCTNGPDEETGLVDGRRRSKNPTWFSQIGGAVIVGFVGFAMGILLMKVNTEHNSQYQTPKAFIPPSQYTKFQPLSFQLYTGGAPVVITDDDGTNSTNPECRDFGIFGSSEGVMYCYTGHKDTTADVADRLAIMTDAVEKAYELSDKSSDTLKVFVAPEFFFRGRNGAYILKQDDEVTALFNDEGGECHAEVCQILKALDALVADARFEDWVFLFGTAVISETLRVEDTWDYLFYNFGILQKGYDPAKNTHTGKRFLIPKRYVSNLDFLTPDRQTGGTREIFDSSSPINDLAVLNPHGLIHKTYDHRLWHAYKDELAGLGYTMIEYGWFLIDGITMTVEICLDHDMRTALTSYLADAALVNATLIPSSHDDQVDYIEIPKHQAQISIVSSAQMTVGPVSLALANEGSIILQDGMQDVEATMTWEYECDKYDWQFDGGSEVVQRNATVTPTEVVFHYQVNQRYEKHSIYSEWKDSLKGVFSNSKYEPMIVAYAPSDIAQI